MMLYVITQNIFSLFLQFGLNDFLCAGRGGLSREVNIYWKVS